MKEEGLKRLIERFKGDILFMKEEKGELTLGIKKEKIKDVLRFLRFDEDYSYEVLTDLCGVDWFPERPRFEVVYLLNSLKYGRRIRIKSRLDEEEQIDTVSDIWGCANWLEREVYDMFGIKFKGHPDLRRILLREDFSGHPLRKDFPTEGYDFDKPFEVRLEEEE